MSSGTISAWLTEIGLPQYIELFEREQIDHSTLADLSAADIEKPGIPLGHRKRLFKAIVELAQATAPTPSSHPSPGQYTPPHLAQRILTSRSAMEGERKLVSVLFCDITRSTELASKLGADAMHALLDRFF